jgi:uncharacterized protein with PQ loop repeat
MENPKYQIIAVIAGILTIIAFSNLVLRVHMTKETEHLTYTWIFLVSMAQSLLVIYGVINNSYGIYIPASILVVGVLYILYVKLHFSDTNQVEDELKLKNILTN